MCVIFPYRHILHFNQIHPFYYSFLPPSFSPPFQQFSVGFIILFSYIIYILHWSYLPPSPLFHPLSDWFLPLNSLLFTIMSYYYYYLGLPSSYEWKRDIWLSELGLFLSLGLVIHSFLCKWQNFILLHSWIILHCVYVPHFLYPFISCWAFRLIP
jgi:hypothetical protein